MQCVRFWGWVERRTGVAVRPRMASFHNSTLLQQQHHQQQYGIRIRILRHSSTGDRRAGPYGLTRIAYDTGTPPPTWPRPRPPPQPAAALLVPGVFLATVALGAMYIAANPQDGVTEYWQQVERGHVVPLYDDDEYDDDEDDDDDDDL